MPRNSLKPVPPEKYLLMLFVAGASEKSRLALIRIRQICEAEIKGRYVLDVIDVYQQPELARLEQIIATPTLVKKLPLPVRRFIGSLENAEGFLSSIGK